MHLTYRRQYQPEQYGAEEVILATTVFYEEGEDPFEAAHAAAVVARNTAHRVLGIPPVRPSKTFAPGEVTLHRQSATATAQVATVDVVAPTEGSSEAPKTTRFTKAAARREIAAMVEAGVLNEERLAVIVGKWDDMAEEIADARALTGNAAMASEPTDEVVSPQTLMTKVADISNKLGDGGAARVRALFPMFSDPDGLPATRLGEIPENRRAAFLAAAEALLSG